MQWWITDGPLPQGSKVDGPFDSYDLAHEARGRLEAGETETYWLDSTQ